MHTASVFTALVAIKIISFKIHSNTDNPNLSAPDDFYEALIHAHQDLLSEESHAQNA